VNECLHCNAAGPLSPLYLCERCHKSRHVRCLYMHRRHWSAAWAAHLERLAARAKAGLPLFGPPLPSEG
jgi:hypothetical protein